MLLSCTCSTSLLQSQTRMHTLPQGTDIESAMKNIGNLWSCNLQEILVTREKGDQRTTLLLPLGKKFQLVLIILHF